MTGVIGGSTVQAASSLTDLLVLLQVITGAVVSTTVTFWLQEALLPQASVACQDRKGVEEGKRGVLGVGRMIKKKITALPLLSVAVGASKVQVAPSSTVLLVLLQEIT